MLPRIPRLYPSGLGGDESAAISIRYLITYNIRMTMIQKHFGMRLYPNSEQMTLLAKTFGCVRFVYNEMLAMQNERYANDGNYVGTYGMNYLLPSLKSEYVWLKEVDATALQSANDHLNTAFQKLFKGQGGHPKFKSKKLHRESYTSKCVNNNIRMIDEHHIQIPKIGSVYFRAGRQPHGKIKRITVRQNPDGKIYASVLCEYEEADLPKTGKSIGIDVGLKDLAILSDGTKIPLPRWDKAEEEHLHYWQKIAARRLLKAKEAMKANPALQLTDFKNYQQARHMCAKIQAHIANQRKDYLDKITTAIVREYDVIAIEDLKTKRMMHNHCLSRAIANAGWNMFAQMLAYKCAFYGKTLIKVNPAYTSQTCSECGTVNNRLGYNHYGWLKVRDWTCPICGAHHDRDINAAVNILTNALTA